MTLNSASSPTPGTPYYNFSETHDSPWVRRFLGWGRAREFISLSYLRLSGISVLFFTTCFFPLISIVSLFFLPLFNRFSVSLFPLCQVIMNMLKYSKIFGFSCQLYVWTSSYVMFFRLFELPNKAIKQFI